MKEKIMAIDRKIIIATIVVVLALIGALFIGSDEAPVVNNETVVAQEEEAATPEAEEAAPTVEEEAEAETEETETTEEAANEESEASTEAETEDAASADTAANYDYVAQVDDSYTKIARKAVQTYGLLNDVSLSQAQIIAAETALTQTAGEPLLIVGESVSLSESDVANAIEEAQALDEPTEALWATYVGSADFNTDTVGEAQD